MPAFQAERRHAFSEKIVYEGCGKNYKRKIAAGKPYWQCSTFLQDGKDYCHAKQIPEDILHAVTPERKAVWQSATVLSILQNAKYKGDAILQKPSA